MKLSDISVYKEIVIQCHDNPDADTVGSGYVLYRFCRENGQNVRLVYSGKFRIERSNLLFLIEKLDIPIEYISSLEIKPELLILVDCQYCGGNVQQFAADRIAVIDHHNVSTALPELSEVHSNIGSCCTILWNLLKKEGYKKFLQDTDVATALFYGLYTDTNGLSEIAHPLDMDMRDSLNDHYSHSLIVQLRNRNISLSEAKIAGAAMMHAEYHPEYRYAIMQSEPCDPNILGLISDFYLSVDSVDVCIVYSILGTGVKFSVRSCIKEVRANDLAAYISDGAGNGGGHDDKAGGFLQNHLIEKNGIILSDMTETDRGNAVIGFIRKRMNMYYSSSIIITAGESRIDIGAMRLYRKMPVTVGWVRPKDLGRRCLTGKTVNIRMLEAEIQAEIKRDTVFLIGIEGEVYLNDYAAFKKNYDAHESPYRGSLEYDPTIWDSSTGERIEFMPYAKEAVFSGNSHIYAKQIDSITKVFTRWDEERYMFGRPGDYLAVREEDLNDVYIIKKEVFEKTYRSISGPHMP